MINEWGAVLFKAGMDYPVVKSIDPIAVIQFHPPIGDLSCNIVFKISDSSMSFEKLEEYFDVTPQQIKTLRTFEQSLKRFAL